MEAVQSNLPPVDYGSQSQVTQGKSLRISNHLFFSSLFHLSKTYGPLPVRRLQTPIFSKPIFSLKFGNITADELLQNETIATFAEKEKTLENPEFVRTFHPLLRDCRSVSLCHIDIQFWVVFEEEVAGATHIGGLEVHVVPTQKLCISDDGISARPDPLRYMIDPRGFLNDEELQYIGSCFLGCCGARLLRSGFLTVIFPSQTDIAKLNVAKLPNTFGGLVLGFDTLDDSIYILTASEQEEKFGVYPSLKLRLEDGREVITTVTHGFVKLYDQWFKKNRVLNSIANRLADIRVRMRESFVWRTLVTPFVGSARTPSSSRSSVGVCVYASDGAKVGTITQMFDDPQVDYPFPYGFFHDLSLIENPEGLPDLYSSPGKPVLSSWAELESVADNAEVFCTGQHTNGNLRDLAGYKLCQASASAVLAGTEYMWDRYYRQAGVALLWRTSHDHEPAMGLSGSPLCLGRVTDRAASVICFQNLQSKLKVSDIREDTRARTFQGMDCYATFKVGFILPEIIRRSTILSSSAPPPPPSTLPRLRRSGTGDSKRLFST